MPKPMHAEERAVSGRVMGTRGAVVKEKVVREARLFLFIFLYLYVLFALFTLHEAIVLAQHHIRFAYFGLAAVNALVLAKVMLVAQDLRLGHRFEDRPVIYPVLIKSVLFAIVFICFRVIEEVLIGLWDGKTVSASVPSFGGGGLEGILSVGTIMSVALIPFFAFTEIGRVLGPGVLKALIFKHRPRDVTIELKLRTQANE